MTEELSAEKASDTASATEAKALPDNSDTAKAEAESGTATAVAEPKSDGEAQAPKRPAEKAGKPSAEKPAKKAAEERAKKPADTAADAPAIETHESSGFGAWLHGFVQESPSWLTSMILHMIVLLVFALITYEDKPPEAMRQLVVAPGENDQVEDIEELQEEPLKDMDTSVEVSDAAITTPIETAQAELSPAEDIDSSEARVDLSEFGLDKAPRSDLLASAGGFTGTGLSGRGGDNRKRLLAAGGGSAGSEKSVAAALRWLAAHQMNDGGWSYNHCLAQGCRGQCSHPGKLAEARNAATAMGLLPFLGAGQTHQEGKYKNTVRGGLYFLVNQMKLSPQGGSLHEGGGTMYSHGLASIALCEAYGMTKDKGLYKPAQAALGFICYAQDPATGGWAYSPRGGGDTSVVGWQVMALKSGHMSYLQVPPLVIKKAFSYLDSVQANSGANYGYRTPGSGPATSAIGLLCRMHLGWRKDNPALQRGVEWISKQGPAVGRSWNMYYNYYATQVVRHWEGDEWKKWNAVMRDALVNAQSTQGHEAGSWSFPGGDHGFERGGRLYATAMATMILEVYYRHMPIYRSKSVDEEFPE